MGRCDFWQDPPPKKKCGARKGQEKLTSPGDGVYAYYEMEIVFSKD